MGEHTDTTGGASAGTGADHPQGTSGGPSSEIGRLRFDLQRNAIYHDARAHWFSGINKLFLLLSILLGSGAILALGAAFPRVGQFAGLLIALISALPLVFDFAGLARTHTDLKRRYYDLLAGVEDGTDPAMLRAKLPRLYAEEPTQMRAVDAIAHNAAGTLLFGDHFTAVRVGFLQRRLRHLLAFATAEFPALPRRSE